MKTTLSLFLYGLLSATAAVAAPTRENSIELQFDAISADLAPLHARSALKAPRSSLNTTLPAAPTTLDLTMVGASGVSYVLRNFPITSQLYAIGGGNAIETVDPWANIDIVKCGFGGASVPNIEYGADNSTNFNPAFVVTKIRCCLNQEECSSE